MAGALDKAFAVVDYLVEHPEGAALVDIATDLGQLRSGCHRTLNDLVRLGYVRPMGRSGTYALTTKLSSQGLSFLSRSGIIDIAQPVIERLAHATEELVRLAIVDGERMTLVAKAQGAKAGLLYDPDMGAELRLSCSAAGHAWLSTLTEQKALEAVIRQGMGDPRDFGPLAPTSVKALLRLLQQHRKRGFAITTEFYAPGMNAMAAVVQRRGQAATGVIVIAGPAFRFTEERMLAHGAELMAAAHELAQIGSASPFLAGNRGTWGNRTA